MKVLSGWDGLDRMGALLTLAIAIALFPLQLFVSSIFIRTIPLALGVGSVLYLLGDERKYGTSGLVNWQFSASVAHVIRLTTVVGFAGMIFVATVTGGRTIPFFGTAAVVGTLLLVQIFFHDRDSLQPTTILAQVVVFALILRGVALVMTPGLIGVDAWVHVTDYAQAIRDAGSLGAISDVKYYGSPLYHLFVVTAAEAFQVPLRIALYATVGVVMPLVTLIVYFLARHLFPVRWALLAAAGFSFADHVVRWGIHLIPTSLGLAFFATLCYLLVKIHRTRNPTGLYALVVLFAVATVFTHQISAFIVLLFLSCGTLAQLFLRWTDAGTRTPGEGPSAHDAGPSVNFAALFVVVVPVTLLNWSRSPMPDEEPFLESMLSVAQGAIAEMSLLSIPSSTAVSMDPIQSLLVDVPLGYQLLDALGLLVMLVIGLVGTFAVLRRTRLDTLTWAWILSAGAMVFVTLGLPLFGLNFLIPNRWFAFLYVPMIVLGTYGLRYVSLNFSGYQLLAVFAIFALVFPGAMLVDHEATPDAPINEEHYHQYAYSESELHAATTISSIHPEGATLATDHPYRLLFRDWQLEPTSMLNLSANGTTTDEYTVYRRAQSVAGPQVEYRSAAPRVQLPLESVCRPGMDVRYANADVKYCHSTDQ